LQIISILQYVFASREPFRGVNALFVAQTLVCAQDIFALKKEKYSQKKK